MLTLVVMMMILFEMGLTLDRSTFWCIAVISVSCPQVWRFFKHWIKGGGRGGRRGGVKEALFCCFFATAMIIWQLLFALFLVIFGTYIYYILHISAKSCFPLFNKPAFHNSITLLFGNEKIDFCL